MLRLRNFRSLFRCMVFDRLRIPEETIIHQTRLHQTSVELEATLLTQ